MLSSSRLKGEASHYLVCARPHHAPIPNNHPTLPDVSITNADVTADGEAMFAIVFAKVSALP